jgi:hypothetical protein
MGKIVRAGAGAGAGIFDKLEPDKNGPALQHWVLVRMFCTVFASTICFQDLVVWQQNYRYT